MNGSGSNELTVLPSSPAYPFSNCATIESQDRRCCKIWFESHLDCRVQVVPRMAEEVDLVVVVDQVLALSAQPAK